MSKETEYTVDRHTAQGWQMAQDRYDRMTLMQRILKAPLADRFVLRQEPEQSTIIFNES
jgi:hypothetical protein